MAAARITNGLEVHCWKGLFGRDIGGEYERKGWKRIQWLVTRCSSERMRQWSTIVFDSTAYL